MIHFFLFKTWKLVFKIIWHKKRREYYWKKGCIIGNFAAELAENFIVGHAAAVIQTLIKCKHDVRPGIIAVQQIDNGIASVQESVIFYMDAIIEIIQRGA